MVEPPIWKTWDLVKLDHFPEIGMIIKNLFYIYIYTSPPSLPLPLLPSAPTSFLSLLLDGLIVSGSLACRSPTGPWDVRIMAVRKGLCPPQTFSKKKCPENGPNPPQNKSRSESTRLNWRKCGFFFSNIRILEFWEMAEECMFQGHWKIWKLKVARLHVSLPVAQEHLIYTEIPNVSGFWCYIKSRWRKHTRIRVSIALVIVFGSYFRLEARLSNLKRWCLPTLAWLFGPCRGPRSQVCDGNLHSSHYQDAANPTMLHVPKSLHIPWTTEDMSISRRINT